MALRVVGTLRARRMCIRSCSSAVTRACSVPSARRRRRHRSRRRSGSAGSSRRCGRFARAADHVVDRRRATCRSCRRRTSIRSIDADATRWRTRRRGRRATEPPAAAVRAVATVSAPTASRRHSIAGSRSVHGAARRAARLEDVRVSMPDGLRNINTAADLGGPRSHYPAPVAYGEITVEELVALGDDGPGDRRPRAR